MNPTFLISSAIKTKFGIYSADQRLEQTKATINSIKTKIPNAKIIIVECSGAGIEHEQLVTLSNMADFVLDFTTDPQVVALYNSTDNWDIVKNGTEIMCFLKTYKILLAGTNTHLLSGQDRLFKMSGRYALNDNFDPSYYDKPEVKDKIVIGLRRTSQFPPAVTLQESQYMSRLWSWPVSMLPEIIQVYSNSINFFSERVSAKGYVDIEHLLARFLNPSKLIELASLGVEGNISPNGNSVKD